MLIQTLQGFVSVAGPTNPWVGHQQLAEAVRELVHSLGFPRGRALYPATASKRRSTQYLQALSQQEDPKVTIEKLKAEVEQARMQVEATKDKYRLDIDPSARTVARARDRARRVAQAGDAGRSTTKTISRCGASRSRRSATSRRCRPTRSARSRPGEAGSRAMEPGEIDLNVAERQLDEHERRLQDVRGARVAASARLSTRRARRSSASSAASSTSSKTCPSLAGVAHVQHGARAEGGAPLPRALLGGGTIAAKGREGNQACA